MMKTLEPMPIGMVDKQIRKKTTRCTPREIIGRIVEIVNKPIPDEDMPDEIRELISEWRYS
jgi:hypothetical protein